MQNYNYKYIIFSLLAVGILASGLKYFSIDKTSASEKKLEPGDQQVEQIVVTKTQPPVKKDRILEVEVVGGSTYGVLMENAGLSNAESMAIYETSKPVYDLVQVNVGRFIQLVFDADMDILKELIYKINTVEELHVSKSMDSESEQSIWIAEIKPIPYDVKIKTAKGKIETSMYEEAMNNNIDERAIINFANAFQWTIDFAMDPRVGDKFKFVYEERYLDGEYIMPGKVLAGEYINEGESFRVYYFEESEDNKGYFDEEGNSVQKMFLKAPLSFKYISSGFTTGRRFVAAFNVSTGHRAIDYAATYGTPIRTVGDGTVTYAGWNGPFGYFVRVRHNSTYTTNYAHQSSVAVRKGQRVKQGDIIGYVGSSGFSTGPHLHYEMVKNGVKINPMYEVLPPGEPIKEENQERFFEEIKKYQEMLR